MPQMSAGKLTIWSEALRSQRRVVIALMLREARTRYGRQRAGYLWR